MSDQFSRMAGMSGGADAGGDQYHAGLLCCDPDATGSLLIAGQIAFSVGANAADVTIGHIKRLVTLEEFSIPVPQCGHGGKRCGTAFLFPVPRGKFADGYLKVLDLPDVRFESLHLDINVFDIQCCHPGIVMKFDKYYSSRFFNDIPSIYYNKGFMLFCTN